MLSNCGHDENNRYSGGQAGDQTGQEWCLCNWYNYSGGWQYMIRHPNEKVGELIAQLAIEAANNDHIGYDQNERYTFWNQLKVCGYRPKNITVNCETDCSAGVAALVKATGYLLNMPELQNVVCDAYTGNIRQVLSVAGFTIYGESKYLSSDKYLQRGDFLLKEYNHICTNVTGDAPKPSTKSFTVQRVAKGSKNESALLMQEILKANGQYKGNLTGLADDETIEALKIFQKKKGLNPDGDCYTATWVELLHGIVHSGLNFTVKTVNTETKNGANSIRLWQRILRANGYRGADGKLVKIDGLFQNNSVYATKCFQSSNGLSVDGSCGVDTWTKALKL